MYCITKNVTWPWFSSFLLAFFLTVGCSQGPPMGEVTGTVTINGELAKNGAVSFIPSDGKTPTAGAAIIDGKYTAMVPIGKFKVEVRVSKVVGQEKLYDTPDSPTRPIMKEVLPAKYNSQSELEMDVQKGANQKDFDLKI